MYTDAEIHGTDEAPDQVLEIGSVGWDDEEEVYDTGVDGGSTYVRVQLFHGRDFTKAKSEDRAQGLHIVARVPSGLMTLPPKGTEVLVAFPGGHTTAIGAGVIVATLGRVNGTAVYGGMVEGEACLATENPDAGRVILKKNGSVNLYTKNGDGQGMAILINPDDDSITITNGAGYGLIINSDGIKLTAKGSALTLESGAAGAARLVAKGQAQIDGSSVMVGSVGVPGVNTAVRGPSGPAATASPKVLIE